MKGVAKKKRTTGAKGKPGDDLQNLIAAIERVVHRDSNVKIDVSSRHRDKDTDGPREHDVVLTFTLKHHTVTMALECRDRSRPVDVPAVEAFYQKCQRTGVNKGIIVSSRGFTQTALLKAASYDVGTLTLKGVQGFNWCMTPGVESETREIVKTNIIIYPEQDVVGGTLYQNDGTLITPELAANIGTNCLKGMLDVPVGDTNTLRFFDPAPNFHLIDASGQRVAVAGMGIEVTYKATSHLALFSFREYADMATGRVMYATATAEIDHPQVKGHIVVLQEEGVGATIAFVPKK